MGPICQLGGTDMSTRWDRYVNSVGPISLGLGHNVSSVRPITQTHWDLFGNNQNMELVRQTRLDQFARLGGTKALQKGNREFALQTQWDRSLISVRPKCYEGK